MLRISYLSRNKIDKAMNSYYHNFSGYSNNKQNKNQRQQTPGICSM